MRVEKTVFISYRHNTNPYLALLVYKELKLNGYDVFYDYKSIGAGSFSRIIEGEIDARAHFIVILTQSALKDCQKPDDWVRREIEHALDSKRNIVPLMFDGFNFKRAKKYLTGKLALLPEYQGVPISVQSFDTSMTQLRDQFLSRALDTILHPTPIENEVEVQRIIEIVDSLPVPTEEQLTAEQYFDRAFKRKETDYDGQIEDYTKAINLNSSFVEAYGNRGIAKAKKKDYADAISDYEMVLRLAPNDFQAYVNIGNVFGDQGDYIEANKNYKIANAINPDSSTPYFNLGVIKEKQGDYTGAMSDFDKALSLDSHDPNIYNNRGVLRAKQGDYINAIEDFNRAISIDKKYYIAYYNRGSAWVNQGDYQKAMEDFKQALRLNSNDEKIYYNRGLAYYFIGRNRNAVSEYNKAIALDSLFVDAYGNRAEAHFALKNYRMALKDFEKSDQMRPNYLMTIAGLAITRHALNDFPQALNLWQKLVALDERYKDAEWAGKEFRWRPELIEEARKLIAKL